MPVSHNFKLMHLGRPRARTALAGCCLSLSACASVCFSDTAPAAPLSPSSPLYNPGAPIVDENPDVSAEYSGKMTELWEYPPTEHSPERIHRTATLEWAEGVSGPVDQIEYTGFYGAGSIHWHVSKLSGSVNEDSTGPGGEPVTCSGSFSPTGSDGGEMGVFIPLDEPGAPAGGGNPATNPDYTVRPPLGIPSTLLSSSGSGACATLDWNSNGNSGWGAAATFGASEAVSADWGDTDYPTVYFPPGASHSQPLNFSYSCEAPACGPEHTSSGTYGKVSLTVTSTLTFSSPGLPGASGKGPVKGKGPRGSGGGGGSSPSSCSGSRKPSCSDKQAAQRDLREQLRPMALECGIATIGTSLLVAGVVAPETGAGSVLAVAGPTGASLLAGAGTACGLLIRRAYEDAKTVEDPPIGSLRKLAQPVHPKGPVANLPTCTTYAGPTRDYCEKLSQDELRYLNSIRAGGSISGAMMLTVDRITGAFKAHKQGALSLQRKHASALRVELTSNLARERSAGAALAKLIEGEQLSVKLTAAQEQAGIARSFSGLGKLGVSGARAEKISGVKLSGVPTDVLAELG